MAEIMARLRGTTGKGRWMSEAAKRNTVALLSTVGLGAVIALWVIPWQMDRLKEAQDQNSKQAIASQEFAQTKLVDILEKSVIATERSTAATQAQTSRMDEQTGKLDDLVDSHDEMNKKFDRWIEIQEEAVAK